MHGCLFRRGQGGLQQQEDPPAPEVPASLEAAAGANRDPDERDGTFWSSEATVRPQASGQGGASSGRGILDEIPSRRVRLL